VKTTFVSVVVPANNKEAYVEKCIESLLRQTYARGRCEIIFIVGNSSLAFRMML
jgi:glycosyltransferase involved in cell wall biosynthesis